MDDLEKKIQKLRNNAVVLKERESVAKENKKIATKRLMDLNIKPEEVEDKIAVLEKRLKIKRDKLEKMVDSINAKIAKFA